ncbi:MAG: TonB-dependent receptor [Candidatus Cyclobacteriaceae bacterium M2_1C_046]
MRILILFFLSISFYAANCQIITVVDSESKNPVANVLIYDEDSGWSIATNEAGKADLSSAPQNTILIFRHPSYQEYILQIEGLSNSLIVPLVEKIIHIQEVVVSANKWEQDIDKVPQEILSINRKTVEQNQPQTSADMLASSGQVFVQKSQLGGGSPMLRGFAANNVLLVIDGVRMNNAIYRSGNLQNVINIDPLALEGTEILFGPGSVMYGSDALGGVMDFHTITPQFSTDKTLLNGQALARYNSANDEKAAHVHFTIGKPTLSFFSSISYNDFEDLKAGENYMDDYPDFGKNQYLVLRENGNDLIIENPDPSLQSPSGFNLFSTINKLRYRKNDLDLTYGFYFSNTGNIPRYDRHIEVGDNGLPVFAEWFYGPQRWMMNSLKAEYFKSNELFDQLRITLANQQVQESRHRRKIGNNWRRNQHEEVDVWSANIDADKLYDKSSLYYGLEVVTNYVTSTANELNIVTGDTAPEETRYPSGGSRWNSYAAYLSYSHELSKKSQLNAGARYNYINLDAKNTDPGFLGREDVSLENGSFTGSIGVVHKPSEHWKLRANVSNGFRAPNVDDVGKIFEVSDNTISVPNENLKPQYTYSAEIATSYTTDKWLLDVTLYQTWVAQVMTRNNFQLNGQDSLFIEGSNKQIVAVTNSGSAQIRGLTASLKHEISPVLALESHFTYTWGEEDSGVPLRHVPPPFGRTSILYRKAPFTAQFFVNYNLRKEPEDIPLSERASKPHLYAFDGSTPGWYTLNVNSSYQFDNGFTIRANAENLLNLNYRTFSSGISAPGRSLILSLSYRF